MRYILCFLLFLISFVLSAQKLDNNLLNAWNQNPIQECIIILNNQADCSHCKSKKTKLEKGHCVFKTLRTQNGKSQENLSHYFNTKQIAYSNHFIANYIIAQLTFEQALDIINRNDIKSINANPWTQLDQPTEEQILTLRNAGAPEWGIQMINADQVWQLGYRGQGVVVGGQDTGYDWDNSLIVSQYRGAAENDTIHDYNWHDAIHDISPLHNDSMITATTNPCGLDSKIPCDDHGHGSHTIGTMVGSGENDSIGVAPKAKWIGCRNMDRGYGKPSTYLECFEWFLAPTNLEGNNPAPSQAPHVINNSWSCPEMEGCNPNNWELFDIAVNNLTTAGIVVVVSAGNSGSNCGTIITPPAMLEKSFAVAATASNDTIAGFSSRGPVVIDSSYRQKPDVAAPGVAVRSIHLNEDFRTWSGTSMAGPHVAATVALMISANPDLAGEVEIITDILKATAIRKFDIDNCFGVAGNDVPNHAYGNGRIDALAAVERALLTSSINENPKPLKIKIFPNPVDKFLSIQHDLSETVDIELFAPTGQVMFQQRIPSQRIISLNLESYNPGIYFIRWRTDNFEEVQKLIVH